METFTTMIMAGGRGMRLAPLTQSRAKPVIRFGGIYRIIDFTLSNCINSGINQIFILTQYASSSLERHIRMGWSRFFRSDFREFIESRPPQQLSGNEWYMGTADCVFKNLDVLQKENREGLLILSGDHIYKMDYRKMVEHHIQTKADFTLACMEYPINKAGELGVITIDEKKNIVAFSEKPDNPTPIPDNPEMVYCNMGIYYFRRDFLFEILRKGVIDSEKHMDFGMDIIPRIIEYGAKISAFTFDDENRKKEKYWRDIGTIDAYFEANMDLVDIDPVFNLYDNRWPIRSFNAQLPPVKTVFNWDHENRVGMALNSLLSPGVIISGGRVERSILSPSVHVHSHAHISNSILFDQVNVGSGAVIQNAIIDHDVEIPPRTLIGVYPDQDRKNYVVSEKGITVVTNKI